MAGRPSLAPAQRNRQGPHLDRLPEAPRRRARRRWPMPPTTAEGREVRREAERVVLAEAAAVGDVLVSPERGNREQQGKQDERRQRPERRPRGAARRALAYLVARDGGLSRDGAPLAADNDCSTAADRRSPAEMQAPPDASRSEAPMPGRGTRHGSTATTSCAASSTVSAARQTSRPSTIDARAANASRTHHAAASGARKSATKVRICASVLSAWRRFPAATPPIRAGCPAEGTPDACGHARGTRQQRHLRRERGRRERHWLFPASRGRHPASAAAAASRRATRRRGVDPVSPGHEQRPWRLADGHVADHEGAFVPACSGSTLRSRR